jgi:phosphoribosylanthranilate isomerase
MRFRRPGSATVLVQIYEARSPAEAIELARAGVDLVGVLVALGGRFGGLAPAEARPVFEALSGRVKRVALSLSSDLEEVARVVHETTPDIIHIGAAVEVFSVNQAKNLKKRFPDVGIMRSIPVVDNDSVGIAKEYEGLADYLLLDSHNPGAKQIGAVGRPHDWSISRQIVRSVNVPAILAGGLGPENVRDAISAVGPAGVDSRTKTDRIGGTCKDMDKVREFVAAAKRAPE